MVLQIFIVLSKLEGFLGYVHSYVHTVVYQGAMCGELNIPPYNFLVLYYYVSENVLVTNYLEIVQKMICQLSSSSELFLHFYAALLLAGIHFCKLRSKRSIFFSFLFGIM